MTQAQSALFAAHSHMVKSFDEVEDRSEIAYTEKRLLEEFKKLRDYYDLGRSNYEKGKVDLLEEFIEFMERKIGINKIF